MRNELFDAIVFFTSGAIFQYIGLKLVGVEKATFGKVVLICLLVPSLSASVGFIVDLVVALLGKIVAIILNFFLMVWAIQGAFDEDFGTAFFATLFAHGMFIGFWWIILKS